MISEDIKNVMPPEIQAITYFGEAPTDIDNCIWLTESGGIPQNHFVKDTLQAPYVELYVRHKSAEIGRELIEINKQALSQFADAHILGIILIGDVKYLGRDDKRRNIWRLLFKILY